MEQRAQRKDHTNAVPVLGQRNSIRPLGGTHYQQGGTMSKVFFTPAQLDHFRQIGEEFQRSLNKTREAIAANYGPKAEHDMVDNPDEIPVRAQVLQEAERLITGDRNKQYGPPALNFNRIAAYWNQYLSDNPPPVKGSDVAMMMVLVKIAREAHGHKDDSTVDAAGYLGLYEELRQEEEG
jgi:hypothetical protein